MKHPALVAAVIVMLVMLPVKAQPQPVRPGAEAHVEEIVKRFLGAVQKGDLEAGRILSVDPEKWSRRRWSTKAAELRQAYLKSPERLTAVRETMVEDELAAVRVDGPPGQKDQYLYLILRRLPAGWRVDYFDQSRTGTALRVRLDSQVRSSLRSKAVELEKAGDAAAAMSAYEGLVKRYPDERLRYARFLRKQGMNDEAVKQYRAYYADNPTQHGVLEELSRLYEANGRFREAIDAREAYMTRVPSVSDGSRNGLLKLWLRAGDAARAREHYLTVAKDRNAPGEKVVLAYLMLGDVAFKGRDVVEARRHYWLALGKTSPAQGKWQEHVHRVLQEQFISQGWLDDAVKACRSYPVPALLQRLGGRLKRAGRGHEMLSLYEQHLLSKPGERTAYAGEGVYDGRMGFARPLIKEIVGLDHGPSLLEKLRAKIAQEPESPYLHNNLAYLLYEMKRYEEALAGFERYIELAGKPTASLYEWLGSLCRGAGLADDAITYYEKALKTEITPEELRAEGMWTAMMMTEGMKKSRFKARLLKTLGGLYQQKKQWADAERCFRAILELKPPVNTASAQTSLAEIWKAMGKENVFLKELKDRVAKAPADAALRCEFAKSLLRAGKCDEAADQYEQAVRLSPDDLTMRLELARCLAAGKRQDQAIEHYEKVLNAAVQKAPVRTKHTSGIAPDSVISELARLCKRTGRHDKLLSVYRGLLKLKPVEGRWTPSEYRLKAILRDMAEILSSRADYAGVVDLWVTHHEKMQYHARIAVKENLHRLDTPEPLIKRLRAIVEDNRRDYWARLMLGDVLDFAGRRDEALEVFRGISRDNPDDRRLREDLGHEYARMGLHKEAAAEYKVLLGYFKPGTSDYTYRLGLLARTNLKLGNKAAAAEQYREALKYDPTNLEYRKALSKATDGREPDADRPVLKAPADEEMSAKRARADLLVTKAEYAEAVTLYKEILAKRSTDVATMVALARAYQKGNQDAEALATFESAYAMRKWSSTDYGTASELERIYRRTKAYDKLIGLFTDRHDYSGVRDFYRGRKEPEKFREYLLTQLEKNPRDTRARFYLGGSYLDGNELPAARAVYERLRRDLTTTDGKIRSESYALQLSDAFERLGEPRQALEILESSGYPGVRDPSDWFGTRMTRLYAKTNRFAKALEICALRLRTDPDGHRTVGVARQIAALSPTCTDGPKLLDAFLKDIEGKIADRHYSRFVGAVRAYRLSHPVEKVGDVRGLPPEENPVVLLKQGRRVQVPQNAQNLADFLDQVAGQAGTVVAGTFRGPARRLPAPTIKQTEGAAFELLARAIDGKAVGFGIGPEGHWGLSEQGDPDKKITCGASGGVICRFWGVNRRPGRPLWVLGHMMFEPAVSRHVVAVQSSMRVLEAVDELGRKMSFPKAGSGWDASGQITFALREQDVLARKVYEVRVETAVAVCTKWATLKTARLDHTEPITLRNGDVTIEVQPLRTIKRGGRDMWELPMDIRRKAGSGTVRLGALNRDVHFATADGKKVRSSGASGRSHGADREEIRLRLPLKAFDPATTSLVVREPADVEVVPVTLTFNDVPIIDR